MNKKSETWMLMATMMVMMLGNQCTFAAAKNLTIRHFRIIQNWAKMVYRLYASRVHSNPEPKQKHNRFFNLPIYMYIV